MIYSTIGVIINFIKSFIFDLMKTSYKILIAFTTITVVIMLVFSGIFLLESDNSDTTEVPIKSTGSEKVEASLYYTTFKLILNFSTLKDVN